MEQKELQTLEKQCIQESPPACTATCPIHVDVKSFLSKIKAGKLDEAFEVLLKKQPFPGIIGRICDQPCRLACKRQAAGEAIAIKDLESYCVINSAYQRKKLIPPPAKKQSIAVVGGGLSGLTAAWDLARKGYPTVIFEAEDRLGGRLWNRPEEELPRQVIREELAILQELGVEIKLHTRIGTDISLTELTREFAVIYLGVGEGGKEQFQLPKEKFHLPMDSSGNILVDPVTFATGLDGVFAGGSMLKGGILKGGSWVIDSVAQGRRAAISMDRYLQKASLTAARENEGAYQTRLYTDTSGIAPSRAINMTNRKLGYSKEEAEAEAGRCLQCQCLECVKACQYLRSYGSYPKKYLREIYNNESIVMGNHKANKMINSCSECGLCAVVCPNGLNMGEVCKKTRQSMVQRKKMPLSAHDFALRDMAFNNSGKFAVTGHHKDQQTSKFLFFPGCQLSGSAPEQVEKVYSYLKHTISGGIGLMLRCCGAPAEWAGRQELFQTGLKEIAAAWESMGKPSLILACSTCYAMFKQYLPEIEIISLWEIFTQYGLPNLEKHRERTKVAVHDACTTRQEKQIHEAVRSILNQLGWEIEELSYNRERTKCCGYGGLMLFANRQLADNVARERIAESSLDYVSYCAMCRDSFAAKGKPSLHLLDLILEENPQQAASRKSPGFSKRQENRAKLKGRLLTQLWDPGQEDLTERSCKHIKLVISSELRDLLEARLILEPDIAEVVEFAENTGNKLVNKENGNFLAYKKAAGVTYWVEYSPQADGFVIHNAYSHRMEISEEVKP